jgi:hypothetical protein
MFFLAFITFINNLTLLFICAQGPHWHAGFTQAGAMRGLLTHIHPGLRTGCDVEWDLVNICSTGIPLVSESNN